MPNSRQVENHCMRSTKLKLRANNTTLLLSSFQLHRHTDVTTAVTYISSVRGPHPFARCMPIVSTQGTVEVFERPTTEGQWWSTCWQVCRRFASRRRSGKKTLRTPAANKVHKFCNHGTKRFHPSDWKPVEVCCRPWTWWCNDATALAGYANMMMTMMMIRGLGDEGFLLPGVYV